MIRFLVTCCVLLIFLPTANAQSFDLPRCDADTVRNLRGLVAEFNEMEAEMGRTESMADVLLLNAEHLRLRRELWDDIQLCDVNLKFISLISARLNDVFAASAIEALRPGQENGPRWKLIEDMGGEAISLMLAKLGEYLLSGLLSGIGDTLSEPLAACSDTQRQYARGAKLKGYIEILNHALAVDTIEDLLRFDAAHLEFRESAWSDLPRCADAYEVAILMFRISGDFVVGHALAFLGVPRDANPYVAQLIYDVSSLPAWMIPAALRDPDAVYALFESNLPGCTAAELIGVAYFGHPLLGLEGALEGRFVEGFSRDNLKTHARIEIDWRNRQFADTPHCTEALALTLTLSEIGSDMVLAQGFWLAGEPDLASLYREQALLGMERLRALQADIAKANEPSGKSVYEETHLPGCTADQIVSLIEPVWEPWREMETIAPNLASRVDFVRYAEAQFAWRRDLLQRLPPCAEAMELSLLLHQGAGIIAGVTALDFAGVKRVNNAYVHANRAFVADANPLLRRMQQTISAAE